MDKAYSRGRPYLRAVMALATLLAYSTGQRVEARQGQRAAHSAAVSFLSVPGARAGVPVDSAAIHGDSIAYAYGYWGSGLYLGREAHWQPRMLVSPASEGRVILFPLQMSRRWIVWGGEPGGGWTVRALDRKTDRVYTIDSSVYEGLWTPPYDLPRISLTGATVAWNYFRCVSKCGSSKRVLQTVIAVAHLPAGRPRVVYRTRDPCDSVWPSLWGKVLVWHQEGSCGGHFGSDIMMANLSTGKVKQVTRNHGASEAVTNGRYVAWKQGAPGSSRFTDGGRMVVLDLATGKRVVAATPPQQKCKPCTGVDAPVMSNQILAWRFVYGGSILARDLATGKDYLASPASDDLAGVPQGAWGKRVLWHDCWQPSRHNGCFPDIAVATIR